MKTIKFKIRSGHLKTTALFTDFNIKNQRLFLLPGVKIDPKYWDEKKQTLDDKHPFANKLKEKLKDWKRELEDILDDMVTKGEFINKEIVQEKLDMKFNPKPAPVIVEPLKNDLIAYFDRFIQQNEARVSSSYISILRQTKKHLFNAFKLISKEEMQKWEAIPRKHKKFHPLQSDKTIKFEDVNADFMREFQSYMFSTKFEKNERGVTTDEHHKLNYIDKHNDEVIRLIKRAISEGHVKWFDLKPFVLSPEESNNTYCDFEELAQIYKLKFDNELLTNVKDLFVLNSFLFLRYSDLKKVSKANFVEWTNNGEKTLDFSINQTKTCNPVFFPVDKNAEQILRKYNFNLPQVTDKEFNDAIKIIGEMIPSLHNKIELVYHRGKNEVREQIERYKTLGTHTCRRSGCTNYYNAHFSTKLIMMLSGHKTEEQLLNYVKASVNIEVIREELRAKIPFILQEQEMVVMGTLS